jgi:RimJ/RimL family protein N-acetyltransferase
VSISIRRASGLLDYLFIRRIRNQNAHMLTGYQGKITIFRQLLFWWNKPKNIRLYVLRVSGKRTGYMLLRKAAGTNYITEVVSSKARHHGYASSMISYAKKRNTHLTAEIFSTNHASIALHEKSGFVVDIPNLVSHNGSLARSSPERQTLTWHNKG